MPAHFLSSFLLLFFYLHSLVSPAVAIFFQQASDTIGGAAHLVSTYSHLFSIYLLTQTHSDSLRLTYSSLLPSP